MTTVTDPHETLRQALRRLRDQGRTTPCAGSPLPTSDDQVDRAQVARVMCSRCPIRRQCAAAGQTETFGVWGGKDRQPRTWTPDDGFYQGRWTDEEDRTLKECGTADEAHERLPHRSPAAIKSRNRAIGHTFGPTHWTDAEDSLIMAAPTLAEAETALPRRTPEAIQARANRIGKYYPRRDGWTEVDLEALRSSTTVEEARRRTGRSKDAVRRRAHLIGHKFRRAA